MGVAMGLAILLADKPWVGCQLIWALVFICGAHIAKRMFGRKLALVMLLSVQPVAPTDVCAKVTVVRLVGEKATSSEASKLFMWWHTSMRRLLVPSLGGV